MIYRYLREHFKTATNLCILEVGAHIGTDTIKLSRYTETGRLICFEPDSRNIVDLRKLENTVKFEIVDRAVVNTVGEVTFYQSFGQKPGIAREITDLSSTKTPKAVGKKNPWARFVATKVQGITLDYYCDLNNITEVDLIWADVQGGELDLVHGARHILQNTKLFYFECMKNCLGLYEGQPSFGQILNALPQKNRWIVEFSNNTDVLLRRV
jgi:FkbM family methyltransferase